MSAALDFLNTSEKITEEILHKPKESLPLTPSPSAVGTVGEEIIPPVYSREQIDTWKQLFNGQDELLEGRVCPEYIAGRKRLGFVADRLPVLAELSSTLYECTGWQLVLVDGLVKGKFFFPLLKNKIFPCTDFVRHSDELNYTPAPDIFHDGMGHLPLFCEPRYASFFQQFGEAGYNALNNEALLVQLGRIYWFTVEFGLMNPTAHDGANRDPQATRIYGAGLASSIGELTFSLSDATEKVPFKIDEVAARDYNINIMQKYLFEISSFDELEVEFRTWAKRHKVL